jgi:ElaB/YqjD/DUF883 family membrane-anchored ribosome-binding protein
MVLAEEKTKTEKQENAKTLFEEVQDTVQKYQYEIIISTGIIATVAVITYILIHQKEMLVQTPTTLVSETTPEPVVSSVPVEESNLTPEITSLANTVQPMQEVTPTTTSTIHLTPTEAETLIEPVQNTFVASEEKTEIQEFLKNITGIAKLIAQDAKNSAHSAKEHIKNAWETFKAHPSVQNTREKISEAAHSAWEHFKTMVEEAKK